MGERPKAILTIILVAIINIINLYGYAVDAGAVVNAVFTILGFIGILWSWWKNQNITPEAQQAQAWLDHMKAEKKAMHAKSDE